MTFGPYPAGHCFHIEKSIVYEKIQKGVKIAEFLLLRARDGKSPAVWVVEAKSSTPRSGPDVEKQKRFDEFIQEIREKFINAFSLGLAVRLDRHETACPELPEAFKTLDFSVADFYFILVVRGHKEAWLPDLRDAVAVALRPTIKTWALPSNAVMVLNDDMARNYGLILPDTNLGA